MDPEQGGFQDPQSRILPLELLDQVGPVVQGASFMRMEPGCGFAKGS